jgi:SpoVK/Ycf46/Vps4 family AAA+-type ATPase
LSNTAINEASRGQSDHKYCPVSYKAIMYFLSKGDNKTINRLVQQSSFVWGDNDKINESIIPMYKVSQYKKFKVDSINGINIYGKVYSELKSFKTFDNSSYEEEINFIELSSKLSLTKIQGWIETKTVEYKQLIKSKSCDTQSLIEISYDYKNNMLHSEKVPWKSNCSFNNRFFTNKDKIVNTIDNFINNEELYVARGIPHTLGFLLWGEPGCGKTGFIKSLMNKTGRHGISIKLNNKFDLSKLKNILFNEEISEDICIPLNNRIIIFEDIDCMADIVKNRFDNDNSDSDSSSSSDNISNVPNNKKSKDNKDNKDNLLDSKLLKLLTVNKTTEDLINNNLSYLLNILDGLEEFPGRIIVMTSNQPSKLDKALIRPGRIDHIIEFTNATLDDIINIIKYYWSCEKKLNNNQILYLNKFINSNKKLNKKYSHAHIVNMCRISSSFEETLISLKQL